MSNLSKRAHVLLFISSNMSCMITLTETALTCGYVRFNEHDDYEIWHAALDELVNRKLAEIVDSEHGVYEITDAGNELAEEIQLVIDVDAGEDQ
jgi:hypothetical protein